MPASVLSTNLTSRPFSPDGDFLYVGNFVDGDVDILASVH